MSQGVTAHQDMERMAKIRERRREERIQRYHNDILAGPDDSTEGATLPPTRDFDPVRRRSIYTPISPSTVTNYVLHCVDIVMSRPRISHAAAQAFQIC